jgi:hypothetical protein
MIKRYTEFINESWRSKEDWDLSDKFYWNEEIESLINELISKSEELKEKYNYGRHNEGSTGFEFDIKARNWPDEDDFDIGTEELNQAWWTFLHDNLKSFGDDIIENDTDEFFEDWYQAGRSGGWLLLEHDSGAIGDVDGLISELLDVLIYHERGLENEEEIELWDTLRKNKGHRLLQRSGSAHKFEDIEDAEEEAKSTIENLKYEIGRLEKLGNKLSDISKRIDKFWKNSPDYFREFMKEY